MSNDYGNKSGESAHGKEISSKPLEMVKAGSSSSGSSGPTGSSRTYPKGKGPGNGAWADPMKGSCTDWAVGGV